MHLIHFDTIDSTNTYAKNLLKKEGLPDGETLLVTADEQTAGRGRLGRSFSSSRGNGLYMTAAFYVGKRPEEALFITAAAAVAVSEILESCGSGRLRIKWVNDIFQNEKKICGILTEAVTDMDTQLMDYAVVGVGINIDADLCMLPETAGSLYGLKASNKELAVMISERTETLSLAALSSDEGRNEILRRYRERSMMTGREVFWEEDGSLITGTVKGIDDECRLIVDTETGRRVLDSGYISVKSLQ